MSKQKAPQGALPRLERHRKNEANKGRKRREISATDAEFEALKAHLARLRLDHLPR
jgi:hypothetical protein